MKDPRLDKFRTFLKKVDSGRDLIVGYAMLAIPTALGLYVLFLVLRLIYWVLVLLIQSA